MQIQIQYNPAHSLATVHLNAGESIRAESSAMVSMSRGIDVQTNAGHSAGGGFLGGLKRAVVGGESFFQNLYTARVNGAHVSLAPRLCGSMVVHEVQPGVVLVPGQVESDASIAYGAPGVRSNLGLLEAVRARRPGDHLVYKPHPDVLAAKRPGDAGIDAARRWCDEIVTDIPMHRLLERVDEVQVLTSLAGFEALLRGKPVVCHGHPFYAGWGLTDDVLPGQVYVGQDGAQIGDRFIPPGAIEMLRANPALSSEFERKYGLGTAAVILNIPGEQ